MVDVDGQIVFLVLFGLVWLLVGVSLLIDGIVCQRFIFQHGVQFELQVLVEVEQGLVEVYSQVGIDVQVHEGCFGLLIGDIQKIEVNGQKIWFQAVWLELERYSYFQIMILQN